MISTKNMSMKCIPVSSWLVRHGPLVASVTGSDGQKDVVVVYSGYLSCKLVRAPRAGGQKDVVEG